MMRLSINLIQSFTKFPDSLKPIDFKTLAGEGYSKHVFVHRLFLLLGHCSEKSSDYKTISVTVKGWKT